MKLLFVCTGNTCRSCMCESIFNAKCDISNVKAFSAGISVIPGSFTSTNSAVVLKKHLDIDISNRKAVNLTEDIVQESDLILTMTSFIRNLLKDKFPQKSEKIFTLNEYAGIEGDIMDPFGSSIDIYNNTYKALEKSILIVIHKIKEDKRNC